MKYTWIRQSGQASVHTPFFVFISCRRKSMCSLDTNSYSQKSRTYKLSRSLKWGRGLYHWSDSHWFSRDFTLESYLFILSFYEQVIIVSVHTYKPEPASVMKLCHLGLIEAKRSRNVQQLTASRETFFRENCNICEYWFTSQRWNGRMAGIK